MTNEITPWDAELQAKAAQSAATESHMSSANKFLSVNSQSQLMFGDTQLVNNQAFVIILDHIIEQTYYSEKFNPNIAQTPSCYAFGRVESGLAPHIESINPVSQLCQTCPNYQWGSGEGKGKACQTRRRLSMLFAGSLDERGQLVLFTPEQVQSLEMAYLRLPVTSVKNLSNYITQTTMVTKRPPFALITKITAEPLNTTYQIKFELIQKVANEYLPILLERNKEAEQAITFTYPKLETLQQPVQQQQVVQQTAQPAYAPQPVQSVVQQTAQPAYAPQPVQSVVQQPAQQAPPPAVVSAPAPNVWEAELSKTKEPPTEYKF